MLPHNTITSGGPPDGLISYYPAVARFLGLSRTTAHRLQKTREIATVRLGSRVLVRESEIARVIADAETRATARAAA